MHFYEVAVYAQLPIKQLFEESRYRSNDWSYHPEAPPPTRPKAERRPIRTDSPLCDVCRSALEYFAYVVGACKAWRTSAEDLELSKVVSHHRELYSLFDEAFSYSCHLCIFLASYMRGPEDEAGMWRHVARDTQVEMSFDVDFTRRKTLRYCRLHFSTTNPKRDRNEDDNYWNFLRLQIWPAKDFAHLSGAATDLDVSQANSHSSSSNVSDYNQIMEIVEDALPRSLTLGGTDSGSDESAPSRNSHGGPMSRSSLADIPENNGRYRPRPCSRDSDSDERVSAIPEEDSTESISSQRLAKEWLDRCQKNEDGQHVDCEGTWLPTRLLDLRHASKTSVLRLVSSREVSDAFPEEKRYITLSHCWGEWGSKEMPVLTSANERDRHDIGISIEKIPQTFQDAITVAQWFQVGWLWIDSLCIIQALQSTIEIHRLWIDLCEMYSEKKLSKPTDKLVAISGLAKEFQKLLPDDIYCSGMWWSTFPRCLRWKSKGRPIQEDLLVAPSWSWASIDGKVKLCTEIYPQRSNSPPSTSEPSDSERGGSEPSNLERHQNHRAVINIQSVPFSGELLDGKTNELIISGFLRRITLVISGTIKMLKYWNKNKLIPVMDEKETNLFLHDDNQQYELEAADVESDLDTGEICETIDGYILFIGACHGEWNTEINGLLLEKRSTEPNRFRRKGIISVSGYAAIALRYKVKLDVPNQQEV